MRAIRRCDATGAAGSRNPRRARTRHAARHPSRAPAADRREARRGDLPRDARRSRTSSSRFRAKASRPPRRTEAWIFFDDENLYFSARCLDSQPERIVANELRHDSVNIFNGGDSMTLVLDTFHDHRNGVLFQTNPLGAQREQAIADGQYIESWNTVWHVRSSRFEGGWSTEMVIPFKSLRYREGGAADLGHQLSPRHPLEERIRRCDADARGLRRLGPRADAGGGHAGRIDRRRRRSRNLELKPYAVSTLYDRPHRC